VVVFVEKFDTTPFYFYDTTPVRKRNADFDRKSMEIRFILVSFRSLHDFSSTMVAGRKNRNGRNGRNVRRSDTKFDGVGRPCGSYVVFPPRMRGVCKKYKTDQKRTQNRIDNFDGLAQSVKEILPQVPLHVIRKDLERTRSIDATVSNLLEGRTPYTPETPPPTVQLPKKPAKTLSSDPSSWKQLFDDRKRSMISECRQKYLMKKKL